MLNSANISYYNPQVIDRYDFSLQLVLCRARLLSVVYCCKTARQLIPQLRIV